MRVGGKHRQYGEEAETNELMSESYSRRSWKGIAIAILIIGAVAAIIALIVIYSGSQSSWLIEGTLKLEDVVGGKYSPKGFSSSVWITGDTFMYLKLSNLLSFNISSNDSKIVVHNSTWDPDFDDFFPSPSGDLILYSFNKKKQFRHSYNASFQVISLQDSGDPVKYNISNGESLQFVAWGPGDKLVYVVGNNIYYLDEYNGTAVKVTNDGEPNLIFNGVPDWVYEEEVFSSDNTLWWSPDGEYFAFLKFNDTQVNDMHYMHYGKLNDYYPTVMDIKYPKPGFNNPEVSLFVVNTSDPKNLHPVEIQNPGVDYITSVTWANKNVLSVMWGPRIQNQSFVSLCSDPSGAGKWACSVDSKDESPGGWLESRIPIFASNGSIYFLIRSNKGFKHIYMNYVNAAQKSIFITGDKYEVVSIMYYDDKNSIYYIRTDGAEKRRLFRLSGIPESPKETCLSCDREDCDWATMSVGSKATYYSLTCATPTTVPVTELRRLDDNMLVNVWETNQELKDKLKNQTLADFRDYTIPVNESDPNGDTIKIRVFVPKNFSESRKYPALINVYGGPGSQMIQNVFSVNFGTYLVTNKNYLYVQVDGRGSGFRGDQLLYRIYKKLGTVEIQDQISAMRYLLRNHSFVETNKVAIWGWSYGGFASAMTLAQGKEIFSCAMSVAPVTSWRYYDSIYTERYMLEPKYNSESYKTSELMNYVSDFRNKPFLLLHGTGDDNVHVQQSMLLTKALNNASVIFDMHLYPDENHSIPKSQLHVYETLEDFLKNCFA